MKAFITTVLAILCLAVIIGGNIHWNNQISDAVQSPSSEAVGDNGKSKDSTPNGKDKGKSDGTSDEKNGDEYANILAYATNWPKEAVQGLERALKSGKPYKIVFAGSESLGGNDGGWPQIVQKKLADTYGESVFSFEVLSYPYSTYQYLNAGKEKELANSGADLIILEPFTLKDNGVLNIEMSEENLDKIIAAVKKANKNTVIILQPPHPLYNASYYHNQVSSLEVYAENHGFAFINHWEAWPALDSKEINDYLTEDRSAPNAKGHKLWADYLIDYLIAK